jgi:centrosomal protein CEP41
MSHRAEVLAEMSEQSEEKNHHHEYTNNNNNHSSTSPVPSLAFTDRSSSTINSQMHPNQHPTLQKLVRGIGELDAYDSEARRRFERAERRLHELQQDADLPYLLLDLRDRDDYDACHIISALSYPIAMLSRSINNETPDMLAYKNQEGKIIVIYDDDERIGTKAATTLVQRGYDNLFLVSGGMFCLVQVLQID